LVELGASLDVLLVVVVLRVLAVQLWSRSRCSTSTNCESCTTDLTLLLLAVPLATGLVAATQSWRRWVGWLCTASLGCVWS